MKIFGISSNFKMKIANNSNYQLSNLSVWAGCYFCSNATLGDGERELNRASLSSVLISRLDGSHSSLDVLVAHVD